ncbi:hypothetical protein WJX72_012324 [[Myrmecia] bisecta]|uniref:Zinc transporter n=1 Tax=[Myrmecia] bisecta TaxID=41462 RepID=A0AAW1Q189_9CHLO
MRGLGPPCCGWSFHCSQQQRPKETSEYQQLHTVGDESADVKPPNKVIVEAPKIPAIWVFVLTCLMAAASGLGATPFLFVGSLSKEWTALANAMACGVMLAASFDLVHEGQPYGANLVILGVVLGAAFIKASQEFLDQYEDVRFESLKGASARKTLLIVGIMGAHALGEGSGVGVSFCGNRGWAQGVLVTLAIGLHNIPEGLAVATVLVARGISARNAMLWAIATSLPQAVVALPAFLFVDAFQSFLPIALGFAAGCMIWMVFAELLPDALEDAKHSKVATAATMSAAWLEALRMMLATLEQPGGKLVSPVPDDMRALLPTIAILLPAALPAGAAGAALAYLSRPGPGLMGLAAGICAWMGLAGSVHAVLATRQIGAFQGLLLADSWDLLSQSSGSPPPSAGTPLGSTVPPSAALASLRPAALQRDSSLESKLASKGRAYVGAFGHAQGVSMRMALAGAAALAAQAVPEGWLMAQSAASSASDASLVLLPAAIMSALRGVVTACLAYPLVGHKSPRVAAVAMLVSTKVINGIRVCLVLYGRTLPVSFQQARDGS